MSRGNGCERRLDTSLKPDLQSHALHRQQGLGVSSRVVNRIMGVRGFAQVLEILEHVLDQSLVERAQVRARMAERVPAGEMPQVPVDELPVEPVVVPGNQF